jgi:hypothetical protein
MTTFESPNNTSGDVELREVVTGKVYTYLPGGAIGTDEQGKFITGFELAVSPEWKVTISLVYPDGPGTPFALSPARLDLITSRGAQLLLRCCCRLGELWQRHGIALRPACARLEGGDGVLRHALMHHRDELVLEELTWACHEGALLRAKEADFWFEVRLLCSERLTVETLLAEYVPLVASEEAGGFLRRTPAHDARLLEDVWSCRTFKVGGRDFRVALSRVCRRCGAAVLYVCSRCHSAHYCSRECQLEDWPSHFKNCRARGHSPAGTAAIRWPGADISQARV